MKGAKKTTMDSAGRLVIPKDVRRASGFTPEMLLIVRWQDGHIEIAPAPTPVRLVRKGSLLVAFPENAPTPLSAEEVATTRDTVRKERR